MSQNDEVFLKKLQATFKIEAEEHINAFSLGLLDLEKSQNVNEQKHIVEILYREIHSLKGAARAVDMTKIETICQSLEDVFALAKKEELHLTPKIFDILNHATDCIKEVLSNPDKEYKDISKVLFQLARIKAMPKEEKKVQKEEIIIEEKPIMISKEKEQIDQKEEVSPNKSKASLSFEGSSIHPKVEVLDTVRVSKKKLDSLLLQGEEMLYAKLSAVQRAEEIKELKEIIGAWKKEWEKMCSQLQGRDGEKKEGFSAKKIKLPEEKIDVFLERNSSRFKQVQSKIGNLAKAAENDYRTIDTMLTYFMEDIKEIMLLPFSSLIEGFPKMVRDLSRKQGKEIEFICNGAEFEIDRRILEELKDPLLHMIRNCIDHGIEKSDRRKELGKPSTGTIEISISQIASDKVKIIIQDNGNGINIDKLKEKAVREGILSEKEIRNMTVQQLTSLIFYSGFSTSDIITDLSGRGLGLAIVREKVEKLGGDIQVFTELGCKTQFQILIPITLSTQRGILVEVTEQKFVVPIERVEKVLRINKDEIKYVENKATILLDGILTPLEFLADILELDKKSKQDEASEFIPILLIRYMEKTIAFAVDQIVIEQEVLVKRLNKQLSRVRNIAGATILGSGKVVPILDVPDLIKSAIKGGNKSFSRRPQEEKQEMKRKKILVVEDSITSRTLLTSILESAGYVVKTAVDGVAGWILVKNEKFDLVVSDVEMPKMNGFELTEKIRQDKFLSALPVVLVTSLESVKDKERGIDVGASAYIVKSNFEQSNLLEVLQRLI